VSKGLFIYGASIFVYVRIKCQHAEYGLTIALSTIRPGGVLYSILLGEENIDLLPPYSPPYSLAKHVPTPLFDSFFVIKWLPNTLNSIPNTIPERNPERNPELDPELNPEYHPESDPESDPESEPEFESDTTIGEDREEEAIQEVINPKRVLTPWRILVAILTNTLLIK
jgi:hypothetical protein